MTREEAIKILKEHHDHWMRLYKEGICTEEEGENTIEALEMGIKAIKALDQEPCEMTAEEYRQRMIQAFHNADTDELISVCVIHTEKEYAPVQRILNNHDKKEFSVKEIDC